LSAYLVHRNTLGLKQPHHGRLDHVLHKLPQAVAQATELALQLFHAPVGLLHPPVGFGALHGKARDESFDVVPAHFGRVQGRGHGKLLLRLLTVPLSHTAHTAPLRSVGNLQTACSRTKGSIGKVGVCWMDFAK